jgi:hypothetical protein
MNNKKCNASSVWFFILLACFSALGAHAAAGQRTLVADKQSFFAWQTKNSDLYACGCSLPVWNGLVSKEQISTMDKQNRSTTAKIIGEIWGGLLGNALGGLLGASALLASDGEGSRIIFIGGSAVGSALGVYLAGNSENANARGRFGMTLLGSLLGEFAAFGLFTSREDGISLIPALLLPVIGAVVGYNISHTSRSLPKGNALVHFHEGKLALGIPDVKLRRMQAKAENAKPVFGFNVRVFCVEL